jgi:peptide/nickel transport system substrate-binding protein
MRKGQSRVIALLTVMTIVVAACGGSTKSTSSAAPSNGEPTVAPTTVTSEYPRAETLYTTGKQWGAPSTWNPLDPNAAMGVVGLQYETLFLYDPFKDSFTPWLAESASWDAAKTVYTIKTRAGVKWADGKDFTAEDVAFTILLAKNEALGSNLWTYVTEAKASDASTVVVTFKNPAYQEWATWTYNSPIVPKHIWEAKNNKDILTEKNQDGVGTGPYKYKTHADDRMVWVKNDGWWGKSAGMDVKPKYIVDLVNGANSIALGQLLQGGIDLSNNFLPGIASVVSGGYGITTYYDKAPFMLSANTAWLVMNTKKGPLADKAFRKAIAGAINVDQIVSNVYGNIVAKANPVGLLPTWDKYVDKATVTAKGFSYDVAKAKAALAAAGYPIGGDGFVTNKDGTAIKLTIMVPTGWSDWEGARDVIITSLKAAGINAEAKIVDYNGLVAARNAMTFDLCLNNEVQIGNTPWNYYDYIFHMPLMPEASRNRNFGGYENPAAWTLVQQLDKTPVDDVAGMQAITKQLQVIQLDDMPVIPMWYNGMWSQVSNNVWTGWPSDKGEHILPATWNGYWQMGAVLMLTKITPVTTP